MYLLSHFRPNFVILNISISPAIRIQEERVMHEAKLAKMEAEMKMVFQQKVQEKEAKLKQSEEELYARHREMKEALEKQRLDLEDKKRRIESGRPLTPEKQTVSLQRCCDMSSILTRCHHYSRKGVGSTFEDNFRPSSFFLQSAISVLCPSIFILWSRTYWLSSASLPLYFTIFLSQDSSV